MPIKVYELAKELKITNTETLSLLDQLGMKRLTPGSDLDDQTAERIRASRSNGNGTAPTNGTAGKTASAPPAPAPAPKEVPAKVEPPAAAPAPSNSAPTNVPFNVSIKELAERLGISASEIQKVLMGMGVLAGLNQRLAPDAVQRIAQKLGRPVNIQPDTPPPAPVTVPVAPTVAPTAPTAKPGPKPAGKSVAVKGKAAPSLVTRPPVVTIMGHVDHGKTSLLDAIRKSSVADAEKGGITQHIGAYQVEVNGQRITFLDTPGHAAFSAMRQRGAQVTDIVVLVVAADDSIMPQTEEAIKIAQEAQVPMIVAVNKVDLPDSDPTRVLTDLTRYEILPEAYGGETQTVNISAKTGEGLQDLLENILLVSEAVVEPKADPHAPAQGTVIEAKVEKGRGPVVSILVQQGTLTVGDVVVVGAHYGKIRTMTDDRGNRLTKAGPSTPVEIIGLGSIPEPGDQLEIVRDEKEARAVALRREQQHREDRLTQTNRVTLEGLYMQLLKGPTKELNVVIKGDVQGSVQAVRDSIVDLGNEEVRVRILGTGVGPVAESDILLVASDKEEDERNALIVGFNVGLAAGVERKAEQAHIRIQTYGIIYELIDAVKEALIALLDPIYEENHLGRATVRALFKLPGGRQIAGSYVNEGIMRRNAKARLSRGKDLLYTGEIDTLRRFKEDAREVAADYECGLTLRGWNDIQEGDSIECYEMREIPREL